MRKLARFLRPYWWVCVIGVLLLVGQALVELNLPNYMSDIVNIGLQNKGIARAAPEVISAQGMEFVTGLMDADDATAFQAAYEPSTDAQHKTFPDVTAADWQLIADAPEAEFSRAMYTFMEIAKQVSAASEQGTPAGQEALQSLTAAELYAAFGQLQYAPAYPAMLDAARAQAAEVDPAMSQSVAIAVIPMFYTELGADMGAMQNASIMRYGGIMLLITLLAMAAAIAVTLMAARLGAGVARDIRTALYRKVTHFSLAQMDEFSTASLITRTTNDVTQVQSFVTMGLRFMIYAPILGGGAVYMALQKSLDMGWIIAAAVLATMCVIGVGLVLALPRFTVMQKLIDRINLVTREQLSGMMVIRAFGTQKYEEKRFDAANTDYAGNNLFIGRAMSTLFPLVTFITSFVMLVIVWVGAHQIDTAAIAVGDMMAFMQYAMQTIFAFLFITMIFIMVPRASVSAKRIAQVLDSSDALTDPAAPAALPQVQGEICFHDVTFAYRGAPEPALEGISFTARPGQTTAIIGATGSGKTTLLNLIPRFYDVTAGRITLDGVDLRELRQENLRACIGMVPQKGVLFTGTIADNLCYGDAEATPEQLERAATIAQAANFIAEKPEGFEESIAQGGTNVSGGQRQRLAIARALVKDASVMLFDDSFSALDFATDAALRAALGRDLTDATVIIVGQRISTIMAADNIIVLADGRIAGQGRHDQLLADCQVYREIAQSQLSAEELGL